MNAALAPDQGTAVSAQDADTVMFFVIGAQKCGTTWLYDYFEGHPAVTTGPTKEYSYFTYLYPRHSRGATGPLAFGALRRWVAGASQLRRSGQVKGKLRALVYALRNPYAHKATLRGTDPNVRAFGEISPNSAFLGRDAFAAMRAMHPQTRFIFILRDPIDRLWSQVRMFRTRRGGQGILQDADALIRLSDRQDYIERSKYSRTLDELEAAVPEADRLILFYEDLFTQDRLDSICDFLGVARRDADLTRAVHKGQSAEMDAAWLAAMKDRLRPVYLDMRARFGARIPDTWWNPEREGAAI